MASVTLKTAVDVSIVVPAYGPATYTDAAHQAVRRTAPDAELIVVDNGLVGAYYGIPDVLVRPNVNVGFARGCNLGAQVASGTVVVFLNCDTEVLPGWLDPLVEHALRGELVQPKLVYPDGTIQCGGVELGVVRDTLTAWNVHDDLPGRICSALTGACLAVRRDLFVDVLHGFDDGYVNGYEDVDLCLRARAAGLLCRYEPASTVVHHESQTGTARWSHVAHNVARLHDLWGTRWRTLPTC